MSRGFGSTAFNLSAVRPADDIDRWTQCACFCHVHNLFTRASNLDFTENRHFIPFIKSHSINIADLTMPKRKVQIPMFFFRFPFYKKWDCIVCSCTGLPSSPPPVSSSCPSQTGNISSCFQTTRLVIHIFQ